MSENTIPLKTQIMLVLLLLNPLFVNMQMTSKPPSPLLHFVLVHGFESGGWAWYKIASLMKKSGYNFSCPDLKSAGVDPTNPRSLRSFEDYNQPLIDLLAALPETDKVILVGHSAGGLSVTHATHLFPQKIQLAVYVAATMLPFGFQTDEDLKIGVPVNTEGDGRSSQHKVTHHHVPQEDVILATLLRKGNGPKEAIISAKFNDSNGINKVKRVYISTLHDKTLKLEQQEAMIMKWKPFRVFTIGSDHSPNVSAPKKLFDLIVKAALEQ